MTASTRAAPSAASACRATRACSRRDDDFWQPLLHRTVPIGEGDLKLTDVTQRVHDAARQPGAPVHGVALNLVVTIDTDSFAIELLQQNRRSGAPATGRTATSCTILCFKERARKRKGDDFITDAHYLCCDTQVLHERVLDYFYGTQSLDAQTRAQQPAALALLASASRAAAATLSRSRACAPTSCCPSCATSCAAATRDALQADGARASASADRKTVRQRGARRRVS